MEQIFTIVKFLANNLDPFRKTKNIIQTLYYTYNMNIEMDEQFWISNPYIILDNYEVIIPNQNMSRIQQMNTVTRLLFYIMIVGLLFGLNTLLIIFCLMGIIIIIFFYHVYKNDAMGIQRDLVEESERAQKTIGEVENFGSKSGLENPCAHTSQVLNKPMVTLYDSVKNKIFKGSGYDEKNISVESGYIDSDGNYRLGPNYSDVNYEDYVKENSKNKDKVSWEKSEQYRKDTCRKPSKANPFANIVFSDYLDASNIAMGCNVDDSEIQNNMQNLYNSTLFRNVGDVWERENSQRMFYTTPIQNVPNSQMDFANWLYKTGPTCHENTQYCTYYQSPNMTSDRF